MVERAAFEADASRGQRRGPPFQSRRKKELTRSCSRRVLAISAVAPLKARVRGFVLFISKKICASRRRSKLRPQQTAAALGQSVQRSGPAARGAAAGVGVPGAGESLALPSRKVQSCQGTRLLHPKYACRRREQALQQPYRARARARRSVSVRRQEELGVDVCKRTANDSRQLRRLACRLGPPLIKRAVDDVPLDARGHRLKVRHGGRVEENSLGPVAVRLRREARRPRLR
mmetsp:Transcript_30628/g.105269  ORF Transcript_30628/g.105269 Transcript_30628/m.105269 type:complete len:231 (-) Transcript_30628:47-739(-)